eukprot:m.207214 g.207214  ORF g.207214 m.207214 type:complete len:216 (-) comp18922_c1_seq2:1002-1649(-)
MGVPQMAGTKFEKARNGALLQMVEAATLGMPFEVWKTHMAANRTQTTVQAFRTIYEKGGPKAFWAGTSAKMVESASKGAVLMLSKELIKDQCLSSGISPTYAGFISGAGGGVCQVSVMGPCTFLVTSMVTGTKSMGEQIRTTWSSNGIRGFYPGGVAIAFRQASNWASRQGFTDAVREGMKKCVHSSQLAWQECHRDVSYASNDVRMLFKRVDVL